MLKICKCWVVIVVLLPSDQKLPDAVACDEIPQKEQEERKQGPYPGSQETSPI
jgi:hypothetical protein